MLDAKYKNYSNLGKTSCENGAISREDLYQMSTYLYRFNAALGIFLSPNTDDVAIEQVARKDSKMALLGINLKNTSELKTKEQDFIKKLQELLEKEQINE